MMAQSRRDLGFDADKLLVLDTHTAAGEHNAASALVVVGRMMDAIARNPGVKSVAGIQGIPMGGRVVGVGYAIHGLTEFKPGSKLPYADMNAVTPEYFKTLGIPLLQGRLLTESDNANSAMVLVVSRELAEKIFPGVNPIGQQIMCGYDDKSGWWTIVGVVGNVRQRSPASPFAQTMYVPVAQHPDRAADMQVVVRTGIEPRNIAPHSLQCCGAIFRRWR